MPAFISCDWGSSALRLRLVDADQLTILAEVMSNEGISRVFQTWQQQAKKEEDRLFYYRAILVHQLGILREKVNFALTDLPVIVSGMASSNLGMLELPYKDLPLSATGQDLYCTIIKATNDFRHSILLISGVRTANDVMRGEETQLIGCLNGVSEADQLVILPGTHSKHVVIKDGKVPNFKTYMTGEFFELLTTKSMLSGVIEKKEDLMNANDVSYFENAVADSVHANLLHSSFLARTNYLFKTMSRQENYYYLSGLLIGTELNEIVNSLIPVTVVSDGSLATLYRIALQKLGVNDVKYQTASEALINGQRKIFNLHYSKMIAANQR